MSQKANPVVVPANEFNDPLQAILSNAEAALLLLSSSNPDIDKIKVALEDVASEVMRVMQRIRGRIELSHGSEFRPSPVANIRY
jgi:hypothetical protein